MKMLPWILGCSLALVLLNPAPAEAQRGGGSVRYSGRSSTASATRATMRPTGQASAGAYSSTPVRYQKPMNMPPPIGSRPSTLPVGHARALYGGRSYYYYGGAYYADTYEDDQGATSGIPGYASGPTIDRTSDQTDGSAAAVSVGRYVVIKPPLGISIDELPYGAKEVKKGVWEYDSVYYRPAYEDGQVKYIVSNP